MADSLTALLIDAKKEYSARLYEIVLPPISNFMRNLYAADSSADRYLTFQKQLSTIPFWNTYIIQEKTNEITRKFPYFENLMAACIVSNVKVLSSIRLSSDRPSIKLKLPGVDVFVHELYKQTAQALYYYPTLMDCGIDKLNDVVFESIERAIRRLIPFDDILESYLQGGGETVPAPVAVDSSSSESESESESESSDEDAEPINVPVCDDVDDDESQPGPQVFPAPPVAPTVPSVMPSSGLSHSFTPPAPPPGSIYPSPPVQAVQPPQPSQPPQPPQMPQAVHQPPTHLVPSTRDSF